MTVLIKKRNIQYGIVGSLRAGVVPTSPTKLFHKTNSNNKLRIYIGTPPANTDEYILNGPAAYASQLAYEFEDYGMTWLEDTNTINMSPFPPILTAQSLVTGTATWFVAKGHDENRIVLGSAGSSSENHSVRLSTTTLNAGIDFSLVGFSITIKSLAAGS